jgi:fatty acid-binding protein DegV
MSFGKDIARILSEEIGKQRKGEKIRIAVAHADNPEIAEQLKGELEDKSNVEIAFVSPVSPVVATHTGPGALLVAFHPVDN